MRDRELPVPFCPQDGHTKRGVVLPAHGEVSAAVGRLVLVEEGFAAAALVVMNGGLDQYIDVRVACPLKSSLP